MNEAPQRFYEFDSFLIDTQQRLLLLDGQPVDLTPKVFDILFELVQNSGRLVEKKELMNRIWPDSFVEEANLTQHISTLRKKLAQHSGKERYVLTVPGRGYRFVAGVRVWDDDGVTTVLERIRSRVVIGDPAALDQVNGDELTVDQRTKAIQITSSSGPPTPSPGVVKRYRAALAVLSLSLLLALTFGVYKFLGRSGIVPFAKTRLVKFTTSGKTTCVGISPDGKYVAFAAVEAGRQSVRLRQVDTSNAGVEVIPPSDLSYTALTFNPDGRYLYYVAASKSPGMIYRVPVLGGTPAKLVDDVDSAPAFSPDGKQMTYVRGLPDTKETSLMVANADGTGERTLASLKGAAHSFVLNTGPSWSPDGKRIACGVSAVNETGEYQELFDVAVDDGQVKPITNGRWLHVGRVAWLTDGSGLIMLGADQETGLSQLWHISYQDGSARKITNDVADYRDLSLTADAGAIAVVQSDQQSNLWLVPNADTKRASQVTSGNYDGVDGLAWLPDGRFAYTTWRNGAEKLWLGDGSKGALKQLTESVGSDGPIAVSPDGRRIAFVLKRSGQQHLWLTNSDGTDLKELTNGSRDNSPMFSPDGNWVVYRSYDAEGTPSIYKIQVSGGERVRLTERISGPPAISPDGNTIACTYRETALGPIKLALIPFGQKAPVRLLDLPDTPRRLLCRWTLDGQRVAFIRVQAGVGNIWAQPLDRKPPTQLTDFKSEQMFNFAFSKGGKEYLVARGHVTNDVVLISSLSSN